LVKLQEFERTLRELLRHSSIVTTQRYARINDDMVRREVERLEMVV